MLAGVQGESREMNSRPILGQRARKAEDGAGGSQAKGKLQSCSQRRGVPADWPQAFGFQGHWRFKITLTKNTLQQAKKKQYRSNCFSLNFALLSDPELSMRQKLVYGRCLINTCGKDERPCWSFLNSSEERWFKTVVVVLGENASQGGSWWWS